MQGGDGRLEVGGGRVLGGDGRVAAAAATQRRRKLAVDGRTFAQITVAVVVARVPLALATILPRIPRLCFKKKLQFVK